MNMLHILYLILLTLILLSVPSALPWPSRGDSVRDCLFQDANNPKILRHCLLGHGFFGIKAQTLEFQPKTASMRRLEISSFQMSLRPARQFEVLAWLGSLQDPPDPELRQNLQPPLNTIAYGLNAAEAKRFCRFMGGKLPSEAQAEAAFHSAKQFFNAETFFYTRDSYREPLPRHYQGRDPVQTAWNHRATIRDLKTLNRRGLHRELRYDSVGVRCVYQNHPVWNYQQPSISPEPLIVLTTDPPGARVYAGTGRSHFLGVAPLIRRVVHGETRVTAVAEGFEPRTRYIKLNQETVQKLHLKLKNPRELGGMDRRRNMPMILIPAGPFEAGINEQEKSALIESIRQNAKNQKFSTEQLRKYLKPAGKGHTVWLPSFAMDQYEISIRQYWDYVESSSAKPPRCHRHTRDSDLPVSCITFPEALAYCRHYGLNLPTEMQWEKASEQQEGLVEHASWQRQLHVQGANPMDVSAHGIHDLNGNVMEWTLDWYVEDFLSSPSVMTRRSAPVQARKKTVRGASKEELRLDKSRYHRRSRKPLSYARDLGFRCVRTEP